MTHSPTIVQIDPDRALCWDRSNSIRIGFDRVLAQVKTPTSGLQRLLGALIAGLPAEELSEPTLTAKHGKRGRELVNQVRPALILRPRAPRAADPQRVASAVRARMFDDGREVPGLRLALEAQWLCQFERGHAQPEIVIQVLRFLEPLERTQRWLSEGTPHLLVRFTDDAVRIGPLVASAGGPCHSCEVLGLLDADPALPALAAQLYGKVPCTETSVVSVLAGAIAASFVEAWKAGDRRVHYTQVVVPVAQGRISGLPSLVTIHTHSECGCSLSAKSPLRQQTVRADAQPVRRSQTQTAAGRLSHA